ncbi:Dcp2, box A domain-domain-containing protein [Phakopsora pachyrhizi]|uniref:Dcp2, box A domain-domain-containing protein n=1 Tax=Phakopsora pachyrhizi TaxID=170000 RepID=A0AAV0BK52_PHAPC|nr:Dcp2, box A domain-domain-containing protein [Phakopsora pachyrhizi]
MTDTFVRNQSHKTLNSSYPSMTTTSSASVLGRMPLEDVLEDLASRFILNLPPVELAQIERICFQVEQAHWFYEDFVRPNSQLNLPSYHLKTFTSLFFEKCHFLRAEGAPLAGWDPCTAFDKFMRYKERVPVCGAIMLNEDQTKVLLVRGFKSHSSWSFPRGKINENELPRDCAVREVLEETGFDITPFMSVQPDKDSDWGEQSKMSAIRKGRPINPTPSSHHHNHHHNQHHHHHHQHHHNNNSINHSHNSLRSRRNSTLHCDDGDHFIEITIREQRLRMYIVTGIPDDTVFKTQTRQEIGRIAWFPLTELPTFNQPGGMMINKKVLSRSANSTNFSEGENGRSTVKFYMVVPFVNDMRSWLVENNMLITVGQSLLTPKAQDNQLPFLNTPLHHRSKPYYQLGEGTNNFHYNQLFSNEMDTAVNERTSRLQIFKFDDASPVESTPPPGVQTTSREKLINSFSTKKKKKSPQKKRSSKNKSFTTDNVGRPVDNLIYFSDQQVSKEEEDAAHLDPNASRPWHDVEEGTRALQRFFFDEDSEDVAPEGSQKLEALMGDYSSSSEHPHNQNHDTIDFIKHTEPRPMISTVYQPYKGQNPLTLHRQVERELRQQAEMEYDKAEPLSEADTDVIKGYDIATSCESYPSSTVSFRYVRFVL